MRGILKGSLLGLGAGIVGGAVAGLLLRQRGHRRGHEVFGGGAEGDGLLPDERLTTQVRDELEGLALWGPRLDVTTIDGVVYLRGREANAARADAIVRTVQSIGGVAQVVDEIRRE